MPAPRPRSTLFAVHARWSAPALGGIAACGFEPLALWPLTLLALAALLELVARAGGWKQALLVGWLFGIGHFTIGNTWIATAFTYQSNMPAWLGWIAVVVLSLYLAVYPALAAFGGWIVHRRAKGRRVVLVLAFAASWIVSEWLRAWVFTGFAWNPLGMVALGPFGRPGLASLTPWLGTYALSGLVMLLAGCWLMALRRRRLDWRTAVLALVPAAAMLQPGVPRATHRAEGIPFTLVQPDLRQETLDDRDHWAGAFQKITGLSRPRVAARRLVLWPESGVPYYLADGYPDDYYYVSDYAADPETVRARIAEAIGPDSLLLTGAVDLEIREGEAAGARNVIKAIDGQGRIRGTYAKAHLVPYGEYLPMRPVLEPLGLSRLVPGAIDFWPGPGPRTLDLGPWGKAGMQICYEIVFSGEVVEPGRRPDYIFNPSNDGWFGAWGPPQHLAQARMRAIEEGLPVLRATTTGISAVIDADGIVRQHIGRQVAGRLDGFVPNAHPPTPFARLGNALPLGWAAVLLALSMVATRRRRE